MWQRGNFTNCSGISDTQSNKSRLDETTQCEDQRLQIHAVLVGPVSWQSDDRNPRPAYSSFVCGPEDTVKLVHLEWENYRRLPDGALDVRNHLVLVGPNDSGKSSILRAINLALGVSGPQLAAAIQERDFTDPSRPLRLGVTLGGLAPEERAAFPDEIDIGPPEALRVTVEADIDPADSNTMSVRRHFPDSGHNRAPSRVQSEAIGWAYVPATRSLIRELGTSGGSAIQSLLSGLDLSEDAQSIVDAMTQFRDTLDHSTALAEFRGNLAESLSTAMPRTIGADELRVTPEGDLTGDPLAGVTITIADGDTAAPLAEQSDGVRALSVLAILGMSQRSARIVGIDEPDTHLHATAQRTIGRSLSSSSGQRCIATHSSAIVSQMNPLDIVAFGADRRARQLPTNSTIAGSETITRHWSSRLLDPLTARCILVVEGPADRIIIQRIAHLAGVDLDRLGIIVFELDGAGFFSTAHSFFGKPGFDLPLLGMLDEDKRQSWARVIGVAPAALESQGFTVCNPDLEGVYVDALGCGRVVPLLVSSGFTEMGIRQACGVADMANVTNGALADFCRLKNKKIRAALCVAQGLVAADTQVFPGVVALLAQASTAIQ